LLGKDQGDGSGVITQEKQKAGEQKEEQEREQNLLALRIQTNDDDTSMSLERSPTGSPRNEAEHDPLRDRS